MVKTVKQLLQDSPDPYKALMSYRATPLPAHGLSPAELLMGRRIRTDIPQLPKTSVPEWKYLQHFKEIDKRQKEKQKRDFDRRHRVKTLPILPPDMSVWVDTPHGQVSGRVIEQTQEPRSYRVNVPSGEVRRNRVQLRTRDDSQETSEDTQVNADPPAQTILTRSRTGTSANPPQYYGY